MLALVLGLALLAGGAYSAAYLAAGDKVPVGTKIAGVDIGATHATAALADLAGRILVERRADLDVATGPEHVLGWVEQVVKELLADQERPPSALAAIGIGLPGPVDRAGCGRVCHHPSGGVGRIVGVDAVVEGGAGTVNGHDVPRPRERVPGR